MLCFMGEGAEAETLAELAFYTPGILLQRPRCHYIFIIAILEHPMKTNVIELQLLDIIYITHFTKNYLK